MKKKLIKSAMFLLITVLIIGLVFSFLLSGSTKKVDFYYNIIEQKDLIENVNVKQIQTVAVLPGFEPVAEDSKNIMFVSKETTNIAVQNKSTGQIIYTACTDDMVNAYSLGANNITSELKSPISLKYIAPDGAITEMDSYDTCIVNGTFFINSVENGVEITYLMGYVPVANMLPNALTKDRYNQILDKMDILDQMDFESFYVELDVNSPDQTDMQKELITKYPEAKNQMIYVINPQLRDTQIAMASDLLQKIGYTATDKEADEKIPVAGKTTEKPDVIKVVVSYTLKDDGLIINIPKDKIKYSSAMVPLNIVVSPYMLSAGKNQSGYMFVPDGSGSIINLNNGKTNQSLYNVRIYGNDIIDKPVLQTENPISANLPVFGIKLPQSSIFAEIQEGEALAEIRADVAGRISNANHVYPVFTLREQTSENYRGAAQGAASMMVQRIQPGYLTGNITVKYSILPKDSGYVQMAGFYRQELLNRKVLTQQSAPQQTPLLLNVVGSVDAMSTKFGIPHLQSVTLTTYKQVQDIGVNFRSYHPVIRLIGGCNQGTDTKLIHSFSCAANLGSNSDFKQLCSDTQIYMEAPLGYVYKTGWFDGFNVSKDTIRFLNTQTGYVLDADLPTFFYSTNKRYAIAPNRLLNLTQGFFKDMQKYDIKGYSPRYLASTVISDANVNNPIFRDQTQKYYSDYFKNIKLNYGYGMIADTPNLYSLPYCDLIANMPGGDDSLNITDYSVPFYQIVVHGSIGYTNAPINFANDKKQAALKAIETGAGISGLFTCQNTSLLIGSDFSYLYSTDYNYYKDMVEATYKQVNEALKNTENAFITNHESLTDEVFKTTYSNGVEIYVNYGQQEFEDKGVRVAPGSYFRTGGVKS
jgi:hypothetical protein